ncbi:MAG: EamA family transporter [Flavobacteriales bacterium]|nr:EamA family transporter [Flavobacteriales bacterium]
MSSYYKNYFILLILSVIWGSSFILMKRGLEEYTDMQVAALRIFIAFISLVPFLYTALKKLKKKHTIPLFITGVIGNGVPAFLFTKAQTTLESSFVGMLNSLTPIFTLFLGIYFFKIKPSTLNIAGVLLGFLGAILLYFSEMSNLHTINFSVLLVVVACLFYGVSVNVIRKYLAEMNPIDISAMAFLYVGPFAGYYVFSTDFVEIASTKNGLSSLGYVTILAILGTSFSVVLFNKLIKDTSAIFAASVTYLIPIVAILWGVLENEPIKYEHYIGVCIILCGVYLVNKKKTTPE